MTIHSYKKREDIMRIYNATVGHVCKLCDKPFKEGEKSTLLSLEPTDPEELQKRIDGKPYITEAVEVHALHITDRP
jgi:hypothetical protein